jgi:hypothetical protein
VRRCLRIDLVKRMNVQKDASIRGPDLEAVLVKVQPVDSGHLGFRAKPRATAGFRLVVVLKQWIKAVNHAQDRMLGQVRRDEYRPESHIGVGSTIRVRLGGRECASADDVGKRECPGLSEHAGHLDGLAPRDLGTPDVSGVVIRDCRQGEQVHVGLGPPSRRGDVP